MPIAMEQRPQAKLKFDKGASYSSIRFTAVTFPYDQWSQSISMNSNQQIKRSQNEESRFSVHFRNYFLLSTQKRKREKLSIGFVPHEPGVFHALVECDITAALQNVDIDIESSTWFVWIQKQDSAMRNINGTTCQFDIVECSWIYCARSTSHAHARETEEWHRVIFTRIESLDVSCKRNHLIKNVFSLTWTKSHRQKATS